MPDEANETIQQVKDLQKMRNLAWQIGMACEQGLIRMGKLSLDKRLFIPQKERKAQKT